MYILMHTNNTHTHTHKHTRKIRGEQFEACFVLTPDWAKWFSKYWQTKTWTLACTWDSRFILILVFSKSYWPFQLAREYKTFYIWYFRFSYWREIIWKENLLRDLKEEALYQCSFFVFVFFFCFLVFFFFLSHAFLSLVLTSSLHSPLLKILNHFC